MHNIPPQPSLKLREGDSSLRESGGIKILYEYKFKKPHNQKSS
ncbi:MAG: hypothetical protein K0S38_387 [Candidatus Paceibacter sp.]|jgi:hypothetical protein|nr:hypothetical protein [Candidatus Paceibacter sp.]